MTIPSNVPGSNSAAGNDTTGDYSFTFRVESISDLSVSIVEDATGNSQEFIGGESARFTLLNYARFPLLGGSIRLQPFTPGPEDLEYLDIDGFLKSGFSIIIAFRTIAAQITQFSNTNNMTPVNVEKALDRLTMSIKACINTVNSALRIATGEQGNPVIPPLIGNADRGLYVNSTEDGFTFGPTVVEIQGYVSAAEAAQVAAEAAQAAAELAQAGAEAAETAAETAAIDAQGYAADALAEANNAQASALLSEDYAEESQRWSERTLFSSIVEVDFSDSPISIVNADKNKMFLVDASLGAVVFNLDLAANLDPDFKIGAVKTDATANGVTVNRTGGDTINGGASVSVNSTDFGLVVYSMLPSTDWEGRYFVKESAVIAGGGGGYTIGALQTLATSDQLNSIDADQFVIPVIGDAAGFNEITGALFVTDPRAGAIFSIRGTSSVNIPVFKSTNVAGGMVLNDDFYATENAILTMYWDSIAQRCYEISRRDAV